MPGSSGQQASPRRPTPNLSAAPPFMDYFAHDLQICCASPEAGRSLRADGQLEAGVALAALAKAYRCLRF
eukprot:11134651-Heterocapsa_arctica.AAC.1